MADFTPQLLPPVNASAMSGMMPFISPDQVAQNQTDMLQWQQRQALAQQLMGAQYQPNSGKVGLGGTILEKVMGALAQNQQNAKLSDILKQQFSIENQAAQAKRAQDIQDEYRKMQEDIMKAQGTEKAKRDYAPMQFQASGAFDPSTGTYTPSAAAASQEVGIKSAEAQAAAKAQAMYRAPPGEADMAKLGLIQKLMAQPDSPTRTAQLSSLLGQGGMQAMMFGGMGGGGGGGGPAMSGPTGDDFLKTVNPALAGQVKAIAEGRQQPPTSMAMRSPMGQALMAAVNQYDPTFDATNYQARSKARNAFTSGQQAQNINSINTAIGHIGQLMDNADSLGNTSFPAFNEAKNWLGVQSGQPQVGAFNQTRDALAGEITKAFRGSSGSEKDIEEVKNNINAAGSPEQLKAAAAQAVNLLGSKVGQLGDQWRSAFGEKSQPNIVDQKVQATLQKLAKRGIDVSALTGGTGTPDASQAAPAPSPTSAGVPSLQDIMAELQKRGVGGG